MLLLRPLTLGIARFRYRTLCTFRGGAQVTVSTRTGNPDPMAGKRKAAAAVSEDPAPGKKAKAKKPAPTTKKAAPAAAVSGAGGGLVIEACKS
jgi:hypothetical protein